MLTSSRGGAPSSRKRVDGIDVIYVKNSYSNYMPPLRKVLSFANFVRLALEAAKKEKRVDVVYATSTPLTVGYIALRLKACRHWPYIFEVRDLWPEFPIQIGAVRNPVLIWALRKLERRIYQKAEHIVALSPGMKEGIVKVGTPEVKVSMVPNMSKPDIYYPHEPNMLIAQQFGIDISKFNVIHFGSMGRANGLDYMIDAARILQEWGIKDVNFVMMGGGATEPHLKKRVQELRLKNIQFLGYHPMAVVSEVVNLCDISITTFLNLPILKTNSPNKLFDSLSAGKPIIVNSAGWTKDLVENSNCGVFVDPDDPAQLADRLIEIKDNTEQLRIWGENARRLSIEVYDKDILTVQVARVVENVLIRYI